MITNAYLPNQEQVFHIMTADLISPQKDKEEDYSTAQSLTSKLFKAVFN
jgi:hypothetical protein